MLLKDYDENLKKKVNFFKNYLIYWSIVIREV